MRMGRGGGKKQETGEGMGEKGVSCGARNVYVVSHSSYVTVRHTMSW